MISGNQSTPQSVVEVGMAPKKAKAAKKFAADAPWRAASGEKAIPRISHGIVFAVREGPNFTYAMSVMKVCVRSFLCLCSS